jgi:BlaI family transcriptional regulator, penicillinase repressor
VAKWQGLTDAEVEILCVLWNRGPSTVRDVFEALPQERPRGYTTVLKLMQLMHEKGLVQRNEDARAHIYSAAQAADASRAGIVNDLLKRLFGGSTKALVLNALGPDHDPKDLAEVERILSEMEEKK